MRKEKILIVDDEYLIRWSLSEKLKEQGWRTVMAETGEEALDVFRAESPDMVLADINMPRMEGLQLIDELKMIDPHVVVVFVTAYSSVERAVKLLKMGAYTYLTKPLEIDEVLHDIENALEKISLQRENQRLQQDLRDKFSFQRYVFNSGKMQERLNLAMRAAQSEASILVTGESGTGKEVMASIIHHASARKDKSFVKVNLSAIPPTLIEAELFGAVKGAYTGAVQTRKGTFEEADGGTLFLDEIGELPFDLQVKLLRALQEREITKLGSNTPIKVDIRLISATNQNLDQLVRQKKFREDLFFRLNVIDILLPPLRERKEEIPHLIDLFIKKFNQRERKQIASVSKDAMNLLMKYHYPGNIRELENIVERAVVLSRGDTLGAKDMPVFLNDTPEEARRDILSDSSLPLPERLNIIEREIILHTLDKHHNNQSRAAQELGISESGLRYKIQSLGITK